MRKKEKSNELFTRACALIPGGVNSPVRACGSVGGEPLFISRADGCLIYDVDDNQYVDYIGSWGPMILGHRHPEVMAAITDVLSRGASFGAPVDLEVRMAEKITAAVDSIEMVRMVNSGTEATMSAVRLARGYTGRDLVIKFDGCYHGHADTLLVSAGSGVATLSIPGSPGVPAGVVENTISLKYNDAAGFSDMMARRGDRVAAVIVEPVAGNMGLVPPDPEFLSVLRSETAKYSNVLIFDEVMSGFRVAFGGAQALYGITPDLTCLGKIVGGGLPVGAYGGKREIMEKVAPVGPVYQAGTLSGNPLAMAAGIATLMALDRPGVYEKIEHQSARLADGLASAAANAGVPATINRVGSMMSLFFTPGPVRDFEGAKGADLDRFARYYNGMLENGIYLPPSQFEAMFISLTHEAGDIDRTIAAATRVLKSL
ncbi:MAG: glutamate-1-semialdehyde 2,1-aminomutase [Deltaproteobacteria bacterium]|nr:glutamate-1-semialdehyde 2,1-aminomutase [Deltaproteobacteria bacterium]